MHRIRVHTAQVWASTTALLPDARSHDDENEQITGHVARCMWTVRSQLLDIPDVVSSPMSDGSEILAGRFEQDVTALRPGHKKTKHVHKRRFNRKFKLRVKPAQLCCPPAGVLFFAFIRQFLCLLSLFLLILHPERSVASHHQEETPQYQTREISACFFGAHSVFFSISDSLPTKTLHLTTPDISECHQDNVVDVFLEIHCELRNGVLLWVNMRSGIVPVVSPCRSWPYFDVLHRI